MAVLPTDGSFIVSATGPTFWFGGTVTDPNSLFGQAFLELQFYPDSIVHGCQPDGGFGLRGGRRSVTRFRADFILGIAGGSAAVVF